ncbi:MAG TPA: septum site-determining protein Ssd [Nocardioidaceae bacterium]|nr:septum site-determining protein Ssd [Nocardioidaceae bacterium]
MSHTEDPAARPLVVTADQALLDDLLRLAAAAGIAPEVIADAGAARRAWSTAGIVVVGDDLIAALASVRPPRRDGVVVVQAAHRDDPAGGPTGTAVPPSGSRTGAALAPPAGSSVWAHAIAIGAEAVWSLPEHEADLVERFGTCLDTGRPATTVAVVGGSGGCGASTFAAGLAVSASDRGHPTLLIDADPLGGGLDIRFGLDEPDGMRWPDLAAARGRLAAPALRAALPRVRDVSLLTWSRHEPTVVAPKAMGSVLDAGQRGHDLVVVDVPRRTDPASEEALSRADHTMLLVRGDLAGISAAGRVIHLIGPIAQRISVLAIQTGAGAVPGELVAESLALPFATTMRPDRRIAAASEEEFVTLRRRRGPLASSCRTVLSQIGLIEGRPA